MAGEVRAKLVRRPKEKKMDLRGVTGQLEAMRAYLNLALLSDQIGKGVAGQLRREIRALEDQITALNDVQNEEAAHAYEVIAALKANEYHSMPQEVWRLREAREEWERRARKAEHQNKVKDKRITELEQFVRQYEPEDLHPTTDEQEVTDTSFCPHCEGPNMILEARDRCKCNFCHETYRVRMPRRHGR
jgi:hypothetical protein